MSSYLLPETLVPMFDAVNQIDIPCFILSVDEDQTIRFGALNAAHEAATGITTQALAGKTPHESLPARMADTVLANYARCLETRAPYAYDELLEMPTGETWWHTSLNPIFDDGRVVGIVGVANDITALRTKQDNLASSTSALRSRSESMETLAHASMSQMRGPLNNIATLARILQTDGEAALQEQPELLDLMIGTAVSALKEIDSFEVRSEAHPEQRSPMVEIDFGHFCRDQAAIIDPDRERAITFPELRLAAEKPRFEAATAAILAHAAAHSTSYLNVSVTSDPSHLSAISLRVRCDVPDQRTRDQKWLISAVRARGGTLMIENRTLEDSDSMERTYACAFPGRILTDAINDDRARAVNRRMKDRASG